MNTQHEVGAKCSKCKKFKTYEGKHFHKCANKNSGYHGVCKICRNARSHEYRQGEFYKAARRIYEQTEKRKLKRKRHLDKNYEVMKKRRAERDRTIIGKIKRAIRTHRYCIKNPESERSIEIHTRSLEKCEAELKRVTESLDSGKTNE